MANEVPPATKIKLALGEVQETLLIPLYGRARDAASRHPVLGDQRARDMVNAIDYDFGRFRGGSLPGSVLRTSIFDGWVRDFLTEHPSGTVVEVGCGLNTRFERVDNSRLRWFDLDLPDTIELWRRFFTEDERRSVLAGSVFDTEWMDAVAAAPGPRFFMAEAVFLYFPAEQVRTTVSQLADRFPGSLLALDTGGSKMLASMKRNGSMSKVDAHMRWVCEDPRQLEEWGLRLIDTRTFATPQPAVAATWPARYRLGMRAMGRLLPAMMKSYRLNLYQLPTTSQR